MEYLDILNISVIRVDITNKANGIYVDTCPNKIDNNAHNIVNKLYNTTVWVEYGINELETDKYITPIAIKSIITSNIFGGINVLNMKCFNPNITEKIIPYINNVLMSGILIYFMVNKKATINNNTTKYNVLYDKNVFIMLTGFTEFVLASVFKLITHITIKNNDRNNKAETIYWEG